MKSETTLEEEMGDVRKAYRPRFVRRGGPVHADASAGTKGSLALAIDPPEAPGFPDSQTPIEAEVFDLAGETIAVEIAEAEVVLPRQHSTRRAVDVALAALGLAVTSPLMLVAAVAIMLDSTGSPLFRQERIGRGGRPFKMLKLRTMISAADQQKPHFAAHNVAEGLFKIPGDPRITRVGRLLRKNHLDELPQLWNVLRGDMTIVGPRPLVPSEHAAIPDSSRSVREFVRPGITGPWQVLGPLDAGLEELAALDVEYVMAGPSARRDLSLLARTALAIASGRGH